MNIWKPSNNPEVYLSTGCIIKLNDDLLFLGYNPYELEGRISSPIQQYKKVDTKICGITRSGREYQIEHYSDDYIHPDAEYVLSCAIKLWKYADKAIIIKFAQLHEAWKNELVK